MLRDAQFKAERETIEKLFKERATGVDTNAAEISTAIQALSDKLRTQAQTANANDFIQARRFVESLIQEARLTRG
jgi:hypothetical protein